MIRVCSYCGTDLGTKCPNCGKDVEPPVPYFDIYQCSGCLTCFDRESGGYTHGICQPCLKLWQALADARHSART
jgi:hypothetical protein